MTAAATHRPRPALERAVWTAVLVAAAVLLLAAMPAAVSAIGCGATACRGYGLAAGVGGAVTAAAWFGAGAAVLLAGGRNRFAAVGGIALLAHPTAFALGLLLPGAAPVAGAAAVAIGLVALALFPDGDSVPRWLAPVVAAGGVVLVGTAALPGDVPDAASGALYFVLFGLVTVGQVVRYRTHADRLGRRQTRWLVYGAAVYLVVDALTSVPYFVPSLGSFTAPGTPYDRMQGLVSEVALLLIPICIGIALVRERLFDVDVLIRRTVLYGALSLLLAVAYAAVVVGASAATGAAGGLVPGLLGALAVALLLQPIRSLLQHRTQRLLLGMRQEQYEALTALGRRFSASLSPEAVPEAVADGIRDALAAPYVAVELHDESGPVRLVERGTRTARCESVEIRHLDESVARVTVGVDALRPLTERDREFLADLARDSAAALHGARVVTSLRVAGELLQESRQQLVLGREEERRRLRADLHDQLGPTLAAAGLTAQAAGDLVTTQPAVAERMLDQLGAMLAAAVGDVRRLVHDLRPPVLDELGLAAALRDRAEGMLRGLDLRFDVPEPLDGLPAAVEVAAFRIGLEALMNVAKHAEASACTATLLRTESALELRVEDDGGGFGEAAPGDGVGLRSMRERATELGGTFAVETVPGRTAVIVTLPLVPTEPEKEAQQ